MRSSPAPALALALALAAVPALAAAPPPTAAGEIAGQVLAALGGAKAWNETQYLRWTFAGRRTHVWDRWTGRHRVEGQDKEGHKYVVIENLNTREGKAWLDGKPAAGDDLKKLLEGAYGAWVNDSYWLLMPYKLQDPGVHLTLEGEDTIDGITYDKLHLSFDKVGLTPGDQYWAWIHKQTHRMDRWAFHLESMKPDEPASAWKWEGWQTYGKIQLAPHRSQIGGDRKLELTDIAVPESVPDTVWTAP